MKKLNYLFITTLLTATFLMSCGGQEETSLDDLLTSGDLEAIREKRKQLSAEQKAIESDIAKLDAAIGAKSGNDNLPLVTTIEARRKVFNHYVELQGDVMTKQNVLIYPEVAGALLKVHVTEGQKVVKGQVLATIDDGGARNELLQMQTQLALDKTTFERQEKLWNQNIGSEIQYLQAKAQYEGRKNTVAQKEKQLARYNIKAPFTGIIDDVIQDEGTVVAPGPESQIFRIVNLSEMYIEVQVPESYITSVTAGKNVKVHFPILNKTVESKVRQTGNFIHPDNRSFSVEIPVSNEDGLIKPNLTAKVQINDYLNEEAILIPQSVISENAEGQQYAFLAQAIQTDNTAKATKNIITTGKTQGDYVEVTSGIDDGSSIIVEGARSVKDGQQIKILEL